MRCESKILKTVVDESRCMVRGRRELGSIPTQNFTSDLVPEFVIKDVCLLKKCAEPSQRASEGVG